MADLTNTSTPITEDGSNFFQTVPGNKYSIALKLTGTAGRITFHNSQNLPYSDDPGTGDLFIDETSQIVSYDIRATGRKIFLVASLFNSMSVAHEATNLGK